MIAKTILIGLTAVALATPAAAQSGGIGAAETSPNLSPNAGGPVGSTAVPRPAQTTGAGSAETSPDLSPNAGGPVGSTTVPRGNNPSTLDVGRQGDCAPEQEAASEQAAGSGNDASHEGVDRQSC
jgi:hypothetical protein